MTPMSRTFRLGLMLSSVVFSGVLLNNCAPRTPTTIAAADAVPTEIDYNWHVRPILSENCFSCHGPDAAARKASLRLDLPEAAYAELKESPGKVAIDPGDPDNSELIRRVVAADPDVRMPPPEKHTVLSERDVAILRQWIEDGAEYKQHWSFITPTRPRASWFDWGDGGPDTIDRFVRARLQREGLQPAAAADKETLINRLSLTLTGLPPSLEQVDVFLNDTSPDAYEKLVDRLLASDAYAEHMAGYWMNIARWAESDGYLDDHHDRLLWPWRDWVISAFRKNMPFNEFGTWQLAGDLMPNATREQILATAFLRVGKRTTENGAIDEEYRIEYVVDRTDTVGTGFLGLTVGCARCHDHKYDPISHKDYFSLSAFFNNTDEPGYYAPGHSAIQAGPTLPWPSHEAAQKIAEAERSLAAREAAAAEARQRAEADAAKAADALPGSAADIAQRLRSAIGAATAAYYPLDATQPLDERKLPPQAPRATPPRELVSLQAENMFRGGGGAVVVQAGSATACRPGRAGGRGARAGGPGAPGSRPQAPPSRIPQGFTKEGLVFSASAHAGAPPALLQNPVLKPGARGQAMFFDETNRGVLGAGVGAYDRSHEFSLGLWFYAADRYEQPEAERVNATGKGLPYGTPIIQHRDDDNSGGAGYRLQLEDGHLWVYLAHSRPANMIALRSKEPFPIKQWVHIAVTYDGSSRAAGTTVYLNGVPAAMEVDHDTLSRSMLPRGYSAIFDRHAGLSFGSRFREKTPVGSGIDDIRVLSRELTPLEVRFLHDERAAVQQAASDRAQLALLQVATDPRVREARLALATAREAHNSLVTLVPQVLVMGDAPRPRPTYRLDRGVYNARAEQVPVQALTQIFPWDESLPRNRLGLARWLFDPRHPLTARVFVNRMWQRHFGQGLVETSEDFGIQGSIPTHPELLDWLAAEFVESGWDVKRLHKLIVMSATYRQTSDASDELLEKDPRNTLLARGIRQRMPAEMVRDNALSAGGLLVQKVGGPSVHPYQPENIWNPLNSFRRYPTADEVPAEEHHRRTIYTFIKRNAPHPTLQIFDMADPNVSTPRRRTSNTPLQALELLNDPQFVEAYRAVAAHVLKRGGDLDGQLTHVYRLATRRRPTSEQLSILREFHAGEQTAFARQPDKAVKLLEVGVVPVGEDLDPIRLAAMTHVTALVMNSPDAYSIR